MSSTKNRSGVCGGLNDLKNLIQYSYYSWLKKIKISGDLYSGWMCRCIKSRKKLLFSRKKEDDRKGIRCDYFIIQNLHTK